jgi:hypothetical protein
MARPATPDHTVQQILGLYRAGKNPKVIAVELGIQYAVTHKIVARERNNNLEFSEAHKAAIAVQEDDLGNHVRALRSEGKSLRKIAELLNITRDRARTFLPEEPLVRAAREIEPESARPLSKQEFQAVERANKLAKTLPKLPLAGAVAIAILAPSEAADCVRC